MQITKVNGEYEMQMTVLVTGFTAPIDSVLVDNSLRRRKPLLGNAGGHL